MDDIQKWLDENKFAQCQKHNQYEVGCGECRAEYKTVCARGKMVSYIGGYIDLQTNPEIVQGNSGLYTEIESVNLTHEQKDILFLKEEGYSNIQIAKQLGVSRQAVENRLKKIKARLKKATV